MRPPVLPIRREMAKTLAKLVSMVLPAGSLAAAVHSQSRYCCQGLTPRDKACADGDRQTHNPKASKVRAHVLQ